MKNIQSRLLLATVVLGILFFAALESSREGLMHGGASPYNYRWDGTSNLVKYLARRYGTVILVENWLEVEMFAKEFEDACKVMMFVSPEKKYSRLEINSISKLAREYGFNIAVFDEGSYTNDIFVALDAPVRIDAFNYVSVRGPGNKVVKDVVPGRVDLNRSYDVVFSFASPIAVLDSQALCIPIAFVENQIVGAICGFGIGRLLVLGDGSIVTNVAIPSVDKVNIYTIVVDLFIERLCGNKYGKAVFFIESSKYRIRPLALNEMVELGYSGLDIIKMVLNPFRYFYAYAIEAEPTILTLMIFLVLTSLTATALYIRRIPGYAKKFELSVDTIYGAGYSKDAVDVVVDSCREDEYCRKVVTCIFRNINSKCVKALRVYLSRNTTFRKRVVEKLLKSV
ncbi:MAG: hypothetical protein QW775_06190 [Ignisphaera sp.]|uniref:DUF4350 domain-containing protein n=1 Tax=Ignisphaera aggregans TaxID=334771 RepID=A0A7C4NLZ8_9CREN